MPAQCNKNLVWHIFRSFDQVSIQKTKDPIQHRRVEGFSDDDDGWWKRIDAWLQSVERLGRIMPLALLHALLLQQSYFGRFAFVHPHFWTLTDLGMAVEAFRLLVQPLRSHDATDLIAAIYSHHCADSTDARVVHAIVHDLALQAVLPKQVTYFVDWLLLPQCFLFLINSCKSNICVKQTTTKTTFNCLCSHDSSVDGVCSCSVFHTTKMSQIVQNSFNHLNCCH